MLRNLAEDSKPRWYWMRSIISSSRLTPEKPSRRFCSCTVASRAPVRARSLRAASMPTVATSWLKKVSKVSLLVPTVWFTSSAAMRRAFSLSPGAAAGWPAAAIWAPSVSATCR